MLIRISHPNSKEKKHDTLQPDPRGPPDPGGPGTIIIGHDNALGTGTIGWGGNTLQAGNGTVSVDGAIAPGASIGTVTITGDTAFNAGSVLRIDLDSDSVGQKIDMLIVNGDLSVDPTATIEFVGDGSVLGLFEPLQHTGSGGMDFLNIDFSQVTGLIAEARLVEVGGSLFLSTVPEPASLGLLALAAGALVVRRRRSGS